MTTSMYFASKNVNWNTKRLLLSIHIHAHTHTNTHMQITSEMSMTRERILFFCPLVSQGMNMWIRTDMENRHLHSCGLKFQWALMSMPSSISSLDSNFFFQFLNSFHYKLQVQLMLKYSKIPIFRKSQRTASSSVFSIIHCIVLFLHK